MFSGLGAWVADASAKLLSEGEGYLRETGLMDLAAVTTDVAQDSQSVDATLTVDNFLSAPEPWRAGEGLSSDGAEAEWRLLLSAALSTRSLALLRPEDVTGAADAWAAVQAQLVDTPAAPDAEESAVSAPPCLPDAAVLQWVQESHDVHAMYSRLVPDRLSEDEYWRRVGWHSRLWRRSRSPAALVEVFRLLTPLYKFCDDDAEVDDASSEENDSGGNEASCGSAAQRDSTETAKHHQGEVVRELEEARWEAARAQWQRLHERHAWVATVTTEAHENLSLASSNAKMLRGFVTKGDFDSDLAVSVQESAAFQHTKLHSFIETLATDTDGRLRGTELDPTGDGGALFTKLTAALRELALALADFEARPTPTASRAASAAPGEVSSPSKPTVATPPSAALAPMDGTAATPVSSHAPSQPAASPTTATAGTAAAVGGPEPVDEADNAFEMKLPWDE